MTGQKKPKNRPMRFASLGRSCQMIITSPEDLFRATELDKALWMATSAPNDSLQCDQALLDYIDTNIDGRITCRELTGAIRWLEEMLKITSAIDAGSGVLQLDHINTDCEPGRRALAAGWNILNTLGIEGSSVTLGQIRQVQAKERATPVSAVGIVLPSAAGDDSTSQLIADVLTETGGVDHPGGEKGISESQLDQFLTSSANWLGWNALGVIDADNNPTEIMPFGRATANAYNLISQVRSKIDQFFAQCEAAVLDERFISRMGWTEEELNQLDFDDPQVIENVLKDAPLSRANNKRLISFDDSINPYYFDILGRFCAEVSARVLDTETVNTLSARQWQQIKSAFSMHHQWVKDEPIGAGHLGEEKLREYLAGPLPANVRKLMADCKKTALALDNIALVEKLLLYQENLMELANNMISFPRLYDPNSRAVFEMGSLVMDGRWFSLAVGVTNRAEHMAAAKQSNMFILYVKVTPPEGAKQYEVAVPVTNGTIGNLYLGKRGVFRDNNGKDCPAKVVALVPNPVSLKEAFVMPFKKIASMVTGKIESIADTAEKKFDSRSAAAINKVPTGDKPAQAKADQNQKGSGAMLMGAGFTIAALGSALAYITKSLSQVAPWTILLSLGIAILAVMVPISIVAILKLRKRDLSAVLEGSGWAINASMRLTRHQGKTFTSRPGYPGGFITGRKTMQRWLIALALLAAVILAAYAFACWMGLVCW